MSKIKNILLTSALMNSMWSQYSWKDKSLQGSPIYTPKRHKFKRRLKR